MSYSQLISLFLILGLINYSHQYNLYNNYIRRRTRDTDLKPNAQGIINKVFTDQGQLESKIQEVISQDQSSVKTATQAIMAAAIKMADAGATNITSAAQWTVIQGQLRIGLNTIMDAYRRFIEIHRQTCDSIETYAKSMITKYESELSTLDQLSVPTTSTGILDPTNPAMMAWFAKMYQMMNYANAHQQTLGTALDCVHDLTRRTLEQQQLILGPPTSSVTVRVIHQADPQTAVRTYDVPCNNPSGYNGCQSCANSLAALTQQYASDACPGQCSLPSATDQYYF